MMRYSLLRITGLTKTALPKSPCFLPFAKTYVATIGFIGLYACPTLLVRLALRLQLLNRHLVVGIDADLAGNLQTLHRDVTCAQIGVLHQSPRTGQRKTAAAANGRDALVRIDHVAITREQKCLLRVRHDQ